MATNVQQPQAPEPGSMSWEEARRLNIEPVPEGAEVSDEAWDR